MSKFTELLQDVDDDCDEEFGDLTRVIPKMPGKVVVGAIDPTRAIFEPVGIVENEMVTLSARGERVSQADRANIRSFAMSVSYQEAVLEPHFVPREGDEIIFLKEEGQPRGRVAMIDPDGEGRIAVYLDRIKT